tara:strand:- start:1176 stop:1412 length:237 start_codon:yes stop_codon:yes gene_type:complete
MIPVEINPKWKLPLTKKQHLIIFIIYSIIYSVIGIDTFFEQYGDTIEVIIYVVLFMLVEIIIYVIFLLLNLIKYKKSI